MVVEFYKQVLRSKTFATVHMKHYTVNRGVYSINAHVAVGIKRGSSARRQFHVLFAACQFLYVQSAEFRIQFSLYGFLGKLCINISLTLQNVVIGNKRNFSRTTTHKCRNLSIAQVISANAELLKVCFCRHFHALSERIEAASRCRYLRSEIVETASHNYFSERHALCGNSRGIRIAMRVKPTVYACFAMPQHKSRISFITFAPELQSSISRNPVRNIYPALGIKSEGIFQIIYVPCLERIP